MQSDEPAFLAVGTEVSAKFKGAFCEAKVKKITKTVKLRVSLKEQPFGNIQVDDTALRSGHLALNELVEVQHGKHVVKGIIAHVKDCSSYHVVFNDGDEKTLRRTQMCLKGAKHFDAAVNLDAMPLYNPEQFSSPVVKGSKKSKKRKVEDSSPSKRAKRRKADEEDESDDEKGKKREKRAAASAATVAIGEMDQGETELSGEASSTGDVSDTEKEKERSKLDVVEKPEEPKDKDKKTSPVKANIEKKSKKLEVGDAVVVRETTQSSAKWYPGVLVSNKAFKKALPKTKVGKKELLVRSFQNGKYFAVDIALVLPFNEQFTSKKNQDNLSTALKTAVDRAQSFLDKDTLPGNWEHADIFGESGPSTSKKDEAADKLKEKQQQKKKEDEKKKEERDKKKEKEKKAAETDSSSSESSGEEDYGEERDIFVAQLYKFQEERGTPINRAPVLGGKDIDLYRFYRVVQHYGGLKKATANGKWKKILNRMKLEGCAGATPVTVKNAYSRYLAHFNSFYKRLGWSLDELASTTTINSPRERRLIRPQTVDNKVKRRKSNAADLKEKEKAKKRDEESKEKESLATSSKNEEAESQPKKEVEDEEHAPPSEGSDVSRIVEKKKMEMEKKLEGNAMETNVVDVPPPHPVKQRRDSTRSASDKKEKKEKLTKDLESERAKEKEPKLDKKEKKEIESEEDGPSDGKRRKERRKMSMKSPKFDLEPMYEDDEPGYSQTDILQHFYMGQKVRSFHHGRWYDARVINIDQTPKLEESLELVTVSSEEDPSNPGTEFKNKLISIMRNTKCLVHYLGWNARYDELMPLNKVRVSSNDEKKSLDLIRNGGNNKVSEERMNWILNWCHSSEGISSMPLDFDRTTPTPNMNFMNGYRPRRVSISQIEQINAAVEGMKREQNKSSPRSVISPTPSIMSSPSSSTYSVKVSGPSKKEEAETPKPCSSAGLTDVAKEFSKSPSTTPSLLKSPPSGCSPVSVIKSPTRESRRQRTSSYNKDHSVVLPMMSSPRKSQSPVKRSVTPVALPMIVDVSLEETSLSLTHASTDLPDENLATTDVHSEIVMEDVIEESEVSFSVVEICEDVVSTSTIEAVSTVEPTLQASPIRAQSLTHETSEMDLEPDTEPEPKPEEIEAEQEMVVESVVECVSIQESSETSVTLSDKTEQDVSCISEQKFESFATISSEPSTAVFVEEVEESEVISSKFEDDLLDEALVECAKSHPDDDVHSEGGLSGSDTPHRTDGEEVDVEKIDDSGSGRLVSPSSRGRGMKRKRFAHRHSQMVVDRKYMKHNKPPGKDLEKKDAEDGSDDEEPEEEGTVARSTFIKQKNAMHRLMEQEKSLHDVSYLGLQRIEDFLHLPADDVIQVCSQRLDEMREMYLQARHDILMTERRYKAQAERKKEKEKALQKERECPSNPALQLPVNGEIS